MSDIVKVKLRAGNREIEIEGDRTDVDELLEKWWVAAPAVDDEPAEEAQGDPKMPLKKKKTRSIRPANSDSATAGAADTFDPNGLANKIKERDDFDVIARKLIHAKGENYNKIALILWAANSPLTSGQIHRALGSLDVKIDLPTVSKTLKANMSKFLTSTQRRAGGPPAEYRLSAQAKSEFENWLTADAS